MTIAPARPDVSDLEIRVLFEEARRRRRKRRLVAGIIIAVTIVLVAGVTVLISQSSRSGPGRTLSSERRHQLGTFSGRTGLVLVFADGLSIDLDHRTAMVHAIPGQRAGDQSWDIVRSGDSIVAGWGDVWATPIEGGPSRLLGPVVTYVPAAEPGAVWLVNYPGGRIGEGTPTLSEVTVTGSLLRTELGPPPSSGVPVVGIPGGIAFETDEGIALWNAGRHAFTRRLGNEAGYIGDSADGRVAWCEGICTSLHVTAVRGADREFKSPLKSQVFEPNSVRLSPDGRYVAAITTRSGLGTSSQLGTLDVIDIGTGRVEVVPRQLSVWSTLTWTSDSGSVFFASDDSHGMTTTIGRIQVESGDSEAAKIPTRNAEQFVLVKRSDAKVLLNGAPRVPASACQIVSVSSSIRPCSYSY